MLCSSTNEILTFIYQTIYLLKRPIPNFVYKFDSLTKCAEMCHNNTEPLEGELFQCYGFAYTNKNNENLCEFFDYKSMVFFFLNIIK